MLFNSLEFIVFITIVLPIYALLYRSVKKQNIIILTASYIFYGWWDLRFLLLISITIIVDYCISHIIENGNNNVTRKRFLFLSIATNLGILCFFKYYNFFANSLMTALEPLGVSLDYATLNIILPVGISFYTFQSMSYVIDVYYKKLPACQGLINYATYVSFFPQLVAGPIERGTHLLPQILTKRTFSLDQFYEGSYLIFWGLFKKVFIADNLSKIVNPIFASGEFSSGSQVILGAYAFAFQIYCDFSAYSDIARGIAKIMGFDLMVNFNLPYISKNPSEFWRRWHISLSTWLRDYLYIPLGGNKNGKYKTYRNLMITMVLGGLWHGAQVTFILWGFYQGMLLAFHRVYRTLMPHKDTRGVKIYFLNCAKVVIFFQFTCIGWLIFRAENVLQLFNAFDALTSGFSLDGLQGEYFKLIFYVIPLLAIQFMQVWTKKHCFVLNMNPVLRAGMYSIYTILFVFFGSFTSNEFIYFQF